MMMIIIMIIIMIIMTLYIAQPTLETSKCFIVDRLFHMNILLTI